MSAPRVGLIGARRVRQGLGPFVARDLLVAGAAVAAVLGTREASLEIARRELFDAAGIRVPGYTRLDDMLAREKLDALVILSPSETHAEHLVAAADAGLHVLCEKPLVWEEDLLGRARACVESFRSRRLLLAENCQWPHTLAAFRALHPDAAPRPARFAMRLTPDGSGEDLVGDCLPHPLSVLQALLPEPGPRLERVSFTGRGSEPADLHVSFVFATDRSRVEAEVALVQGRQGPRPAGPRPASLALDGHLAERRVKLPEYTMEFADDARSVPLPDPLSARIAGFVAELRDVLAGGAPPDPAALLERMALLATLRDAYRLQVDGASR